MFRPQQLDKEAMQTVPLERGFNGELIVIGTQFDREIHPATLNMSSRKQQRIRDGLQNNYDILRDSFPLLEHSDEQTAEIGLHPLKARDVVMTRRNKMTLNKPYIFAPNSAEVYIDTVDRNMLYDSFAGPLEAITERVTGPMGIAAVRGWVPDSEKLYTEVGEDSEPRLFISGSLIAAEEDKKFFELNQARFENLRKAANMLIRRSRNSATMARQTYLDRAA